MCISVSERKEPGDICSGDYAGVGVCRCVKPDIGNHNSSSATWAIGKQQSRFQRRKCDRYIGLDGNSANQDLARDGVNPRRNIDREHRRSCGVWRKIWGVERYAIGAVDHKVAAL